VRFGGATVLGEEHGGEMKDWPNPSEPEEDWRNFCREFEKVYTTGAVLPKKYRRFQQEILEHFK
jgi:hypothetical protein